MSSMSLLSPHRALSQAKLLQNALVDSRQRWRDLVLMAADFAFETDASGRLVFVSPDPVLGWPVSSLVGQPAEILLADGGPGFNPFRPSTALRKRRVWLKRKDGRLAYMAISAAPLTDRSGQPIGARGVGTDLSAQDGFDAQAAAALRRSEILEHIMRRMREEVLAPQMMGSALDELSKALTAEGIAVVDVIGFGEGPRILHLLGDSCDAVLSTIFDVAGQQLTDEVPPSQEPVRVCGPEGRPVLACPAQTRFGEQVIFALWRTPGSPGWDEDDIQLAFAAVGFIRMILEHEAIQREMARQARTDPLTGLANRRAFREDLARHIDRLEREELPGTLIFADLDNLKPLNDKLGHDIGDQAICRVSQLLRDAFRPTDLVARFGGDEFAIWMNGADHLTAAERAEMLQTEIPKILSELTAPHGIRLTMSIGIATREPGTAEEIESVIRRADLAMYEVKRNGRAHWRVAPGVEI
ncbi:MAG: GGDEF domain-containing protein [Acetobacteraceae bacterium]|nr:GGDEF domain-containing protein [Acetobacteraceae bacterium]